MQTLAEISYDTTSNINRQRISINAGWQFYKYDSIYKVDKLIYDGRSEVIDNNESRIADVKPTEAVDVKSLN